MKCRDCVDKEGWGYAKTGYFEGGENTAEGMIDHQEQGKEKAVEERNECAEGGSSGDPGGEGVNKPVERENENEGGGEDNGNWGLEEGHSPGCTCDKTTTFLCMENLSGGVEI